MGAGGTHCALAKCPEHLRTWRWGPLLPGAHHAAVVILAERTEEAGVGWVLGQLHLTGCFQDPSPSPVQPRTVHPSSRPFRAQ